MGRTKDPYMLVLTADKEDVEGLPASVFAAAAPRRPRPAKRSNPGDGSSGATIELYAPV